MAQYWPFSGLLRQGAFRDRLIVSLDMVDRAEALDLVDRLSRAVGMFKVGRTLFIGGGADFVREIRRRGAEVFLDLKFRDSPRNVIRAAIEATRLGVKMFDIHAHGCTELMARARNEVSRVCRAEGLRRPHIVAVAMLAPLPGADRSADGRGADHVVQLAREAANASLDGVFTSAHEVQQVRNACGRRFIIVASGVQTRHGPDGDSRTMDAADAIRAGADFLVVGSPIWRAQEPIQAVREITEEMERAMRASPRATFDFPPPRSA
ncbi:MAG TPA: orotidine-5'-phosphate decarboxylase [Candidatus Binataceae bacterium]|nr:orotidine-5'-phosphate decarboxylase [Candidatus Binataceae bacterium]